MGRDPRRAGRALSAVFAADPEGFREQNAGREPAMLVKELVQNALDEPVGELDVRVAAEDGRVVVEVSDDVSGGIREGSLIFTIWASDKQDSPRKRGRMGRGLKEIVSVADRALITSEGCAFVFERSAAGTWTRRESAERTARGTRVRCEVGLWSPDAVDGIVRFLERVRPPEGVRLCVNGRQVERTPADERYELELTTVVYETTRAGRVARERRGRASVELVPAVEPWIYEMGIPIEPVAFPCSIDIGQRVPLRDRRDTVTERYRQEIFGALLSARAERIDEETARSEWVLVGARSERLSHEAKERIAQAYTGGHAFAASGEVLREATGHHVPAVSLRSLPEAVRDIVREVGTDARTVLDERRTVHCPAVDPDELTRDERRLAGVFERIAAGVRRPCRVTIRQGRPSSPADFERASARLSLYRERLGSAFFSDPLAPRALALLIHELAHWTPLDDAHGFDFKSDLEQLAGEVAAYALEHAEELRTLATS